MTMFYNLVSDTNGKTLTLIFSDGSTIPVSTEHPRYQDIFQAVIDDTLSEEEIRDMANLIGQVGDRLSRLSERVSISGGAVLFDGDEVHGAISDHILRLIQEGDEYGWLALVNFLEKIQTNPNEHSRGHLYDWISGRDITITRDGDLIAYKGVKVNEDGVSQSIFSGTAVVNGVVHEGNIPNPVGGIIEMPRSKVQHDPRNGCSTGLHAGTWEYASWFSQGRILMVRINPRDVVSVPTDSSAQKMRVSRYEVLAEVTEPQSTATYTEPEEDEEADLEYCDWCGDPFPLDELDADNTCSECAEEEPEPEDDDEYYGNEGDYHGYGYPY